MSGIDVVSSADPAAALERAADPGQFVVQCLERGKSWLAEALEHGDLEGLVNLKGYAETLRVATTQKQLGRDAELSASELVRRAERAIGLAIRAGQEAGEIRRKGQREDRPTTAHLPAPSDFASKNDLKGNGDGVYAMADGVTDDDFEQAIAGAKAEGNLSRANVARKVKGEPKAPVKRNAPIEERVEQICSALARSTALTSTQISDEIGVSPERVREIAREYGIDIPADRVVRRQKIDPNYVIEQVIDSATPSATVVELIAYSELDRSRLDEWVSSLSDAIRSLQTIKRNLQKELTQ